MKAGCQDSIPDDQHPIELPWKSQGEVPGAALQKRGHLDCGNLVPSPILKFLDLMLSSKTRQNIILVARSVWSRCGPLLQAKTTDVLLSIATIF